MSLPRLLKPDAAAAHLAPFAADFARRGKRLGLDVDREVLARGLHGSGAAVFPGRRCDFAELADERGSTFIDGDLVVDGWIENEGGVVFVRGNLIARSLTNSGYLVVAGDLLVDRFFGEGERHGTFVFGDATVTSAVLSHGHRLDAWGECHLGESVDGESEGDAAVRERLHAWGVLGDGAQIEYLAEAREGLRGWAQGAGKLPEDWASRRWVPRPPPVVEAPPPPPPPLPRAAVLVELEQWFGKTQLTQREQLDRLRTKWLDRIGPDERAEAKRLIRRAVNSKKLVDERDELLRALE